MSEYISLLKPHEDKAVYRVPDPEESWAYVEIGLYGWEFDGRKVSGERIDEDGIGVRIDADKQWYPTPSELIDETILQQFRAVSRGCGSGGRRYRLLVDDPSKVRVAARAATQRIFAYWWVLDAIPDNEWRPRVSGLEPPEVDRFTEDGTVVLTDGRSFESPYALGDMELLHRDEWKTPRERCQEETERFVDQLVDKYPETDVRKVLQKASDMVEYPDFTETDEHRQERKFRSQLRDIPGVGHRFEIKIVNEFDSMKDLCDDIREGGKRLRSIDLIGEKREQKIIDGLVEEGHWHPDDEQQSADG